MVPAYKRTTTELQELSSAILNGTTPRNTKGDSTIAEVKNTEETLVEEKEEKTTAVVKDKKTTLKCSFVTLTLIFYCNCFVMKLFDDATCLQQCRICEVCNYLYLNLARCLTKFHLLTGVLL